MYHKTNESCLGFYFTMLFLCDREARPVAQPHEVRLPRCKATGEAFLKKMPRQHTDDRSFWIKP
ncbi:MAG: hypothetical protein KME31_18855 [Tolypothrix carrinoi HA7290-LM1]|nr:hypothetical protein [Tolypothrix carrinoi HA7290-LM1]